MQRIRRCSVWKRRCAEDAIRECTCIGSDPEERQVFDKTQTSLGGALISSTDFVHDEFGNMQVEAVPLTIPPITRKLLMGQSYDIAAGACCKVADDVTVEICCCQHDRKLPQICRIRKAALFRALRRSPVDDGDCVTNLAKGCRPAVPLAKVMAATFIET